MPWKRFYTLLSKLQSTKKGNDSFVVAALDEPFKRHVMRKSLTLVSAVAFLHPLTEIYFFKIPLSAATVFMFGGALVYAFLAWRIEKWSIPVSKVSAYLIVMSLPYLSAHLWMTAGITSAAVGWYYIFPLYAALFNTKKTVIYASMGSILAIVLMAYLQERFPFHAYYEYPATAKYLITFYMFAGLLYHMYLFASMLESSEKQRRKNLLISQHQFKLVELGQMAGHIAHELNTPLTVLTLFADELESLTQKYKLPEETMAPLLSRYRKVVQKASATINTILNSSRSVAEQDWQVIDPNALINDLRMLAAYRLRYTNVDITYSTNFSDSDLLFSSNYSACSQVLMVLLNNAIDALSDLLPDKPRWVHFKFESDTQKQIVFVNVSDSGPGLPKSVKSGLFKDNITTKKSGHGLGLMLAKELASQMGGDLIYLDKTENTTFQLQIPITEVGLQELTPNKEAS